MVRPLVVDELTWAEHTRVLADTWVEYETPHISIVSPTGGGKTYLWRYGLLPLLHEDDQFVILDVKGDDTSISGIPEIRRVRKLPNATMRKLARKTGTPQRYQAIISDREQARAILHTCHAEGNWVIFIDETRAITDRAPQFGLASELDGMWLRDRSRGNIIVAATQAPRFVPASFYEQASHLYIGPILDKRARRRLQEIGGDTDMMERVIAQLRRYEWLYVGPLGEDGKRVTHITRVA